MILYNEDHVILKILLNYLMLWIKVFIVSGMILINIYYLNQLDMALLKVLPLIFNKGDTGDLSEDISLIYISKLNIILIKKILKLLLINSVE